MAFKSSSLLFNSYNLVDADSPCKKLGLPVHFCIEMLWTNGACCLDAHERGYKWFIRLIFFLLIKKATKLSWKQELRKGWEITSRMLFCRKDKEGFTTGSSEGGDNYNNGWILRRTCSQKSHLKAERKCLPMKNWDWDGRRSHSVWESRGRNGQGRTARQNRSRVF